MNNFNAITENVIPFFRKFGFLSAKKKRDFSKFIQIADIISVGDHLTQSGIEKVLRIRRDMNDGGKRKYSEEDILSIFKESSETTRQASQ